MKKILTLAAALMVFGASASLASGLNLRWDGCSDGGVQAKTFLCNTNTGAAFVLYTSVVVPADMPMFAATSALVDIAVDDAALPAWWQTTAGQCSANRIDMGFAASSNTSNCADIWQGNPNLSVFQVQQGVNGPNKIRLNGGAAVPAGSELAMIADGAELVISRVTITRAKSTGTGACAGCLTGACIVFNEAKLQQPAGIGDYTVTNAATPGSNFVTWQAGMAQCPIPTPAQNRTWGAVKNLYR